MRILNKNRKYGKSFESEMCVRGNNLWQSNEGTCNDMYRNLVRNTKKHIKKKKHDKWLIFRK